MPPGRLDVQDHQVEIPLAERQLAAGGVGGQLDVVARQTQ
jgi:hypothetical protein